MSSKRQTELSNLKEFITRSDNEITMILQSLQWNRETLVSTSVMDTCSYNTAHKTSTKKLKEHEEQCWLRTHGYMKEEKLLPEPLNSNAHAIVKLNSKDINSIIAKASRGDLDFKKMKKDLENLLNCFTKIIGNVWDGPAPLTLERLQATYTVDERRAIYDAVVASDPTSHDISDLALNDANQVETENKRKSRIEILSELRDMRRRRTKYRVAAKTKKYSDVLRDVIKTQMEMYSGISEHEDTVDKTSLGSINSHNDIKREKNSPERGHNEMFDYENTSTSDRPKHSRDERRKDKYSSKTKRDTHIDEANRQDRYYKRHRGSNLDHKSIHYKDHGRSEHKEIYGRSKHDDHRRGNRHDRSNRERYSDESKRHDSAFKKYRQGTSSVRAGDQMKIREECKNKYEK